MVRTLNASITEVESEALRLTLNLNIDLDASIAENSTAQYSFQTLDRSWHTPACTICAIRSTIH